MNIGFIGLGKLGLPCAEVFTEHFPVRGFDVIDRSQEVKNVIWSTDLAPVVSKSDCIFIAVPTPHHPDYDGSTPTSQLEPKDFDYSEVKKVLHQLENYDLQSKIVVLISTVLPGTFRGQLVKEISFAKNLIYNPYLIAMGTEAQDMIQPEMIIVGTNDGQASDTIEKLHSIYKKVLKKETRFELGTWEEAEAIKIFYNTFISAKLGLVNMIQDVAHRLGHMNADVVASALAKSQMRIMSSSYMKPGMGDGGPCHPRDNIALRHLSQNLGLGYDLFGNIMEAREKQAYNMAQFIAELGSNICILGKAFKPDVEFTQGSSSLLVGYYLEKMERRVTYDQHLANEENWVFLLAHQGRFHDYPFPAGSTVVDPWREFPNQENLNVIQYGNTRT